MLGLNDFDVIVNNGIVDVAFTFQGLQVMMLNCENSCSIMIWITAR